jgi:hypothetical protein
MGWIPENGTMLGGRGSLAKTSRQLVRNSWLSSCSLWPQVGQRGTGSSAVTGGSVVTGSIGEEVGTLFGVAVLVVVAPAAEATALCEAFWQDVWAPATEELDA